MLLGEQRIRTLSATDTWMLLQCAYLHDFGMSILYEKIVTEWNSDEFEEYKRNKIDSGFDEDTIKAFKYIDSIEKYTNKDTFDEEWPLKVKNYVTWIIADYFREKHSSLTREYLNLLLDKWKIDFSHNRILKDRFLKLIGEISFLHTQDFQKVLDLDYKANGYKSDYIHPRFIAEMLRIGDLLDLDNGRFNEYIQVVVDEIPKISKLHKDKHNSTRHVLVTPEEIEVTADCNNPSVYRETREWILWLDQEINKLTVNWVDIVPKSLTGYAPKFTKKQILINGKPDLNNLIDLKFEISQEKAFEVLEGNNLYKDKFIFIREFIQNAQDASKIQLWRDIKDGTYKAWIDDNVSLNNLEPYDICQDIYNNYLIEVEIKTINKNEVEIIISDRGTGISIDTLKCMSRVAENNVQIKKEIKEMPDWLKPTAGFGIGIQSAFSAINKFQAISKCEGSETIYIKFESRKANGYISVTNSEKEIIRGTRFCIEIKNADPISIGPLMIEYLNGEYDPIIDCDLLAYKIYESIIYTCNSNIIPIKITIDDKVKKERINKKFRDNIKEIGEHGECEDKYKYNLSDDYLEIKLWDKENNIYSEFCFSEGMNSHCKICFKGMNVKDDRINNIWVEGCFDIYGFDSKKSLFMDRSKLKNAAKGRLLKVFNDQLNFYISKVKTKLDDYISGDLNDENKDYIILKYLFFKKLHEHEFSFDNNGELIGLLKSEIRVFYFTDEQMKEKEISIRELFNDNLKFWIIKDWPLYDSEYKYKKLKEKISTMQLKEFNDEFILADGWIYEILKCFNINKIKVLDFDDEKLLLLKIDYSNNDISVDMDIYTKDFFIKNLVPKSCRSNFLYSTKRSAIPVMKNYEELALSVLPDGIASYNINCHQIISPILREDRYNIIGYKSRWLFRENIIKRDDFKKLVQYTIEHRLSENAINKERIIELYENLIGEYYDVMQKNDSITK